jgi:hypothetical protein
MDMDMFMDMDMDMDKDYYWTSASGCYFANVHNYICMDIVITQEFLLQIPNFHIIIKDRNYELTELP